MRYLQLGHSGLRVSELCLGTMTFGTEMGIGEDEAECRRVFDTFVQAGGNFFDTANIYNAGTSERMLGQFIGRERDRYVIASKYSLTMSPDDPNAGGNHRKNLACSLKASLERLGTDYIDLYWVHGWDRQTPVAEVMRALDDEVRAGRILHVGASNAPAWWVAKANTLARERGWTPFTTLQLHYNLLERSIETDFLDLAATEDMGVTAWSPLASGILTGKYNEDRQQEDAQARLDQGPARERILTDAKLRAAADLGRIADDLGCSSAQLALAWMLQRSDRPVLPIIGARRLAQLEDNLQAVSLDLAADTLGRLDALHPPPETYPSSLLESAFFRYLMFGKVPPETATP